MVEQRWRRPGLMGPVLLITLGVLFLLSTLGLLQVSLWELWRLWPLLLVLAGLDILSRHSRWGSAVVAVLTLGVVAFVVFVLVTRPEPLRPFFAGERELVINPVSQELGAAQSADINLSLGVGELRLSALQDSTNLLQGHMNYPQRWGSAPAVSYAVDGGVGQLWLTSRSQSGWAVPFTGYSNGEYWDVGLSRHVPLNITLDAGASSSILDLSYLQLRSLSVKAGVGRMEVRFPSEGDRMTARIEGGVGELMLNVPESVAARVNIEGGLGSKNLSSRFEPAGDGTYETANYSTAANHLDITVAGGLGSLTVQ